VQPVEGSDPGGEQGRARRGGQRRRQEP
jgi:hypothetical protein